MQYVLSWLAVSFVLALAVGAWLQHKDELIREADFDSHWETAQELIEGQ